ncbi:MAG TPA: hypothetical protein DCX14_11495 [Flavobacteriales bacterium]|jgi:hypothetical protein|nr:hypothetical protein [Flavobacteriales bacterium]
MSPKEISEILAFDRSKISIHRLILKLEKDGFDFQAFFDQLPSIEFPTRWYMTWMLTHYVERNTEEGTAHQDLIWSVLKECDNQSMLRDLWRTMSLIEVNEELAVEVYDAATKTTICLQRMQLQSVLMPCSRQRILPCHIPSFDPNWF